MKDIYTTQYLADKFNEHALLYEKERQKSIHEFAQNNENTPLPDWFSDNFNLSLALAKICEEIEFLKNHK
jgi:hypothetical protein